MKIDLGGSFLVELADIKDGECFIHEQDIFIKSDIIITTGEDSIMCVRLEDGVGRNYDARTRVNLISLKVVRR